MDNIGGIADASTRGNVRTQPELPAEAAQEIADKLHDPTPQPQMMPENSTHRQTGYLADVHAPAIPHAGSTSAPNNVPSDTDAVVQEMTDIHIHDDPVPVPVPPTDPDPTASVSGRAAGSAETTTAVPAVSAASSQHPHLRAFAPTGAGINGAAAQLETLALGTREESRDIAPAVRGSEAAVPSVHHQPAETPPTEPLPVSVTQTTGSGHVASAAAAAAAEPAGSRSSQPGPSSESAASNERANTTAAATSQDRSAIDGMTAPTVSQPGEGHHTMMPRVAQSVDVSNATSETQQQDQPQRSHVHHMMQPAVPDVGGNQPSSQSGSLVGETSQHHGNEGAVGKADGDDVAMEGIEHGAGTLSMVAEVLEAVPAGNDAAQQQSTAVATTATREAEGQRPSNEAQATTSQPEGATALEDSSTAPVFTKPAPTAAVPVSATVTTQEPLKEEAGESTSSAIPSKLQYSQPAIHAGFSNDNMDAMDIDAHPPAEQLLEVDSLDSDSAIDVDTTTYSQSVRSSIYEFVEENGRRYHRYKEGRYFFPNDETEQERLDLQHQLFLITFNNNLSLAPVGQLHDVLDIGTGTGIWAIDFALRNPAARVLGTDLSPIQPEYLPPNCSFEIDDAEDPWVFPHKFDLVHGRALASCFKDPQRVIDSAAESLNPNGWLEIQDICIPLRCLDSSWNGSAIERWCQTLAGCAQKVGRDTSYSTRYASMFAQAGLVDITERHFVWPSCQWVKGRHNKKIATWFQKDLCDGMLGLSLRLMTSVGGMSVTEVEELVKQAKADMHDTKIHCYMPVVVVMGRKPAS